MKHWEGLLRIQSTVNEAYGLAQRERERRERGHAKSHFLLGTQKIDYHWEGARMSSLIEPFVSRLRGLAMIAIIFVWLPTWRISLSLFFFCL